MDNRPQKWAVVIVGPPGSGKDTQAELIAREFNLSEIKSSSVIQKKFASADPNDSVINREKEINNAGGLNSSDLVAQWLEDEITEVGESGKGLVLVGGLRRASEASRTMGILKKYYSLDGLKVVFINLGPESSLARNSGRRVCELNRHPILDIPENSSLTACPQDGSPIITRYDDNPETAKKRYGVYLEEMQSILDFLSKNGYNVITINGEQSVEDVHREMLNKLW